MRSNLETEIKLLLAHISTTSRGIFSCSFSYNKKCNIIDFYSDLTKKQSEKIRSKCPYYKGQCEYPRKKPQTQNLIF